MRFIIAPLLKVGKKNSILADELCSVLNIDDKRSLYSMIETERRAGALIIGSSRGYFLPETVREITAYTARVHKRIKTERENVKAFERALEVCAASATGQLQYDESGQIMTPTPPVLS